MDPIRQNAFRVLALPVDASRRQLTARADELLTYVAINHSPTFEADIPCLGPLDRTEDSIRRAQHELQDVRARIRHTLFWFWEQTEIDGKALRQLRNGDKYGALATWQGAEEQGHDTWSTYCNEAVLRLILLNEEPIPRDPPQSFDTIVLSWHRLLSQKMFWEKVVAFVPGYSPSPEYYAEQELCLELILGIVKSDNRGNGELVQFLASIRKSAFPLCIKESLIDSFVEPLEHRVRESVSACCNVRTSDRPASLAAGRKLLEDIQSPLSTLSRIVEPGSDTVIRLRDQIAREACYSAIAYGNETSDHVAAYSLLADAYAYISDPAFREETRKNLDIVKKNIEVQKEEQLHTTCWYCGRANAPTSHSLKIPLHKVIERNYTGVRYRTVTIPIPRCPRCRSVQWVRHLKLIGIPSLIVVMLLWTSGSQLDASLTWGSIVFAIAYFVRIYYLFGVPKKTYQFPPLHELLADGWVTGSKPSS